MTGRRRHSGERSEWAPLASPLTDMRPHYSVVVVGSGYGGGIAASRLARAGQQVCVLERGAERRPGEYPDTTVEAERELLDPNGLFDLHRGDGIDVLVGRGLGGTSLINANVGIEADPRVFEDDRWPPELRGGTDSALQDGYRAARAMLRPVSYADDTRPLPKLAALRMSAHKLGHELALPPLYVTFEDGVNDAGIHQPACTLCGDCTTGCNYGSKNTTLMNYLPDAARHGAQIFTNVEVQRVERSDSGHWNVHYRDADPGRARFHPPDQFVSANIVVLGAGTLGSTGILLRSHQAGLPLSSTVGTRFSGNGDVVAFAYDSADVVVNGVGVGSHVSIADEPVGPCITGMVDLRDQPNVREGMVLQEGVIPGALGNVAFRAFLSADAGAQAVEHPGQGSREAWEHLTRRAPALARTQTYLVMTHDRGDGRIELEDGGIKVTWPHVAREPIFDRADELLRQSSEAIGARYLPEPLREYVNQLISVHPLGGCCMGDRAEHGVVNHKGQVFASSSGTTVHEGLYVADGAVIPCPLGVNPSLTISAVAERTAALIASDHGWTIDEALLPPAPRQRNGGAKAGLQFTETMKGFISTNDTSDYNAAFEQGQRDNSPLQFVVTIVSDDVQRMLDEPAHEAQLFGTVVAPALSPAPLTISAGTFQLFVEDPEHVDSRRMCYRMTLTSEEGRTFHYEGYKEVHDAPAFDVWHDTTTLYVTIYAADHDPSVPYARGILQISPGDFYRQLRTMQVTGVEGVQRLRYLGHFMRFFADTLAATYAPVRIGQRDFSPDLAPVKRRELRAPVPVVESLRTNDGVRLRLTRYEGGRKGPVLLAPGFGVSSASFATDTVRTNPVEYLVAHGYDVWLFDYRASPALRSARTEFTVDKIACFDWPAAVAHVRSATGSDSVQAVVHCVGSMSFLMAMLVGLDGVRSAVCSALGIHPVSGVMNRFKAGIHLAGMLERVGVSYLSVEVRPTMRDRLLDAALRLYPIPRHEACDSPVCRRIFAIYGPSYNHAQLDAATHDEIPAMFGLSNTQAFAQLTRSIRKGYAVDSDGHDVYRPHVDRLAIPIRFITGAENHEFLPSATQQTLDWLREHNDPALYDRRVIPGYGHMDCWVGRDAANDVYPLMVEHLDITN